MSDIILAGCTPTPLANYLKALGIFRLVAEQKDPAVKACWRGEQFVVFTELSAEEMMLFFRDEYRPTPILSPWNGRAGYLEGSDADDSSRRGPELLKAFRNSSASRLSAYRDLILALDELEPIRERDMVRADKKALEKEKKEHSKDWNDEKQQRLAFLTNREEFLKEQLIRLLRNALPDENLTWLDAVVAIGCENRAFAPLFGGSGGVEGSMDIGVNFMDNLLLLFTANDNLGRTTSNSTDWLAHALYGSPVRITINNTAGSLAPNWVGGPNGTTGFSRKSSINPWDFILMIEGAIIFKPSMTKKLGSTGKNRMSYPFAVEPRSIGSGAISANDEKKSRAGASEVWMPLWSTQANYTEIVTLFREGSVRLGARVPLDGLDMARSIAKLGVDRGMSGFQRFLFLKRSGDNDLAVPLNRFQLTRKSPKNVDLITDFERGNFLDLLLSVTQDKDAATSLKQAIAQLQNSLFVLTEPGVDCARIQRVLIMLGAVMQTLAVSLKGQKAIPILPSLSSAWIDAADDGSTEFRLALALASLPHITAHIAPVMWSDTGSLWQWQPESRLHVWGHGGLSRNLVRIAERRIIETKRRGDVADPFGNSRMLGGKSADIHRFIADPTVDARTAALLQGLIWVRLTDELNKLSANKAPVAEESPAVMPIAYRIIKPCFMDMSLLSYLHVLPKESRWNLPPEIPRLLCAGRVQEALACAWRRSRIAGLGWPVGACPRTIDVSGPRLLAALIIPLQPADLARLFPRVEHSEPESPQS